MNSIRKVGHQWQANHIIIDILEKSKTQDDFILENMRGICAIINESGQIFRANCDLAGLLESSIANVRKHSLKKLFTDETWQKFQEQVKQLDTKTLKSQTAFEIKTDALSAKDQKSFLFEIYVYGKYKNKDMNFYFILGTDITNLRTIENKLKEQVEENRRLVRIITHDIASPLTVIEGMSRNLNRSNADIPTIQKKLLKGSETIKEILSSVRNLQAIIDGVKKVVLIAYPLDLMINNTLALFDEKLKEKNITVEFVPCALNVFVEAKMLSNQVLSNLMSNAIKFTFPNSKIVILIEETNDFVTIKIKDCGTGIPSQSVPKLFIISENSSTPGTLGEKGTGYGLPICKSIMELMGGTISVESKYINDFPTDHGTTFSVSVQKIKSEKIA
jgi:signal transduction histidine kinase